MRSSIQGERVRQGRDQYRRRRSRSQGYWPLHLVDVWNPSYDSDAMTAHLAVLLESARDSPTARRMPEISRFLGIVIRMYFQDHEPPHFHATYGGAEARVRISPIGLLDGDIPPHPLALAVEWATLHEAELLENWSRLRLKQPPVKIAPLE